MKKLTLIIAIVFSGMLIKAQTLKQVSYKLLGQESKSNVNFRQSTDYGSFVFKGKEKKGMIVKVTVTITNDHPMYDSIMNAWDYHSIMVGSMWTDLIFNFKPVEVGFYDNIEDAERHLNNYMNTDYPSHKNTKIYKHPKKEKYIVGMLTLKRYQGGWVYADSFTKKMVATKRWRVL